MGFGKSIGPLQANMQYFMALGLLVDGKIDLAMSIVEHCIFEIKHYNKVLNGNRSYVSKRNHLNDTPSPGSEYESLAVSSSPNFST